MPTPRLAAQIGKQAGGQAAPGSNPNDWIPGLVLSAPSGIGGTYQVSVQGGAIANATSALDAAITEGSLVWVVKSGGKYLITGLQ